VLPLIDNLPISARSDTPDSERLVNRALREKRLLVCNDLRRNLQRGRPFPDSPMAALLRWRHFR
jgi:hypothetical protein